MLTKFVRIFLIWQLLFLVNQKLLAFMFHIRKYKSKINEFFKK